MRALDIRVERNGNLLMIGDSPKLIVDLKDQENYIVVKGERFPYKENVELSADLISGKRKNVFNTAIRYYYSRACQVAEGMQIAAAYRANANITQRELK